MDLTSKKNFMQSLKLSDQVVSGILTFAFGLALYGILFAFTYNRVVDTTECFLDLCLLNLGVACGWLLGIYVSPDTQAEAERFTRLGTAVGSFLTGYVLSKSDALLQWIFAPNNWSYPVAFRFILWVSGVLIAGLVSYTLREYILASPAATTDETKHIQVEVPPNSHAAIAIPPSIPPAARLNFIVLKGKGPLKVGRVEQEAEDPLVSTLLNDDGASASLKPFSALGTGSKLVAVNSGTENVSLRVEVLS